MLTNTAVRLVVAALIGGVLGAGFTYALTRFVLGH
jgi:LPS O-antigen subunit length determinant protein (WzzB/FepE family)